MTCFTDADISTALLREHFGFDLDGVTISTLPSPRLPRRRPEALRDLARDYIHTKTMRNLRPRLFVNMKFKSELPGVGSHNWYYAHFPHRTEIVARSCAHALYIRGIDGVRRGLLHRRARRFIDSYQVVLANSEFTRKHIRIRWSVDATTLYPPCSHILGSRRRNGPRRS